MQATRVTHPVLILRIALPAAITLLLLPFSSFAQDAPPPPPPVDAGTPPPPPVDAGTPPPPPGTGTSSQQAPPPPPSAPGASAPAKYEPPMVTINARSTATLREIQNGASPITVEGMVRAFNPPASGYVVQIMFLGELNNYGGARAGNAFITSMAETSGTGQRVDFQFPAPPPKEAKFGISLPGGSASIFSGRNTVQTPYLLESSFASYSGWICRVLADGNVLYTSGSTDTLTRLFKENPSYLNQAGAIYNRKTGHTTANPGGAGTPPLAVGTNAAGSAAAPEVPVVRYTFNRPYVGSSGMTSQNTRPIPARISINAETPPEGGYRVEVFFVVRCESYYFVHHAVDKSGVTGDLTVDEPAPVNSGLVEISNKVTQSSHPHFVKLTNIGNQPLVPVGCIMRIYAGNRLVGIQVYDSMAASLITENGKYFDETLQLYSGGKSSGGIFDR